MINKITPALLQPAFSSQQKLVGEVARVKKVDENNTLERTPATDTFTSSVPQVESKGVETSEQSGVAQPVSSTPSVVNLPGSFKNFKFLLSD